MSRGLGAEQAGGPCRGTQRAAGGPGGQGNGREGLAGSGWVGRLRHFPTVSSITPAVTFHGPPQTCSSPVGEGGRPRVWAGSGILARIPALPSPQQSA